MWIPLVVLAALSIVGGVINLPFSHKTEHLLRWLEPVLGEEAIHHFGGDKVVLAAVATAAALIGLAIGWNAWSRKADRPELEPEPLRRAWYIDPLYQAIIARPGQAIADTSAWVDRNVVDGAVNGVAVAVREGGSQLRRLQTGYVRNYALAIAAGTVGLLTWFLLRAQG
jgi:NADH-quinone oxidoreductase subunit L